MNATLAIENTIFVFAGLLAVAMISYYVGKLRLGADDWRKVLISENKIIFVHLIILLVFFVNSTYWCGLADWKIINNIFLDKVSIFIFLYVVFVSAPICLRLFLQDSKLINKILPLLLTFMYLSNVILIKKVVDGLEQYSDYKHIYTIICAFWIWSFYVVWGFIVPLNVASFKNWFAKSIDQIFSGKK